MSVGAFAESGGLHRLDDNREQASALLAGRLCNQLFGPVAEPWMPRPEVGDDDFVPTCAPGLAKNSTESQTGVVVVRPECGQQCRGVVEQPGNVDACECTGHQPECRQRAVATAHIRIGEKHPVAGGARRLFERRAGIGDHHDAFHRIDAGVAKRLLVHASVAVGLERAAALARNNKHRVLEAIGNRRRHLTRVGGVKDSKPDACGGRDDFGGE